MNQLAPAAGNSSQLLSRYWDYRTAVVAVGYLACYILLDWLSYVQPVLKLGITPWNPQAGLTLAFLLVYGPRWASVTAVAVLLSEILVRQNSVASSLVIGVSMWIALGYGVLAALLRRWRLETPIRTLGAAVRLAVASVAACRREILAAPFGDQEQRLTTTLGKAAQEAIRASEVLRRLRDFYRGGTLKCDDVHLPTLCSDVSQAFQSRLRRAAAALAVRVDSSLPNLAADTTQLEIVLHNLISNAIDAVSQVARPARRIELHAERADRWIVLRVEDSGPGIVPEVAQKLFEPFVTSKPDGMGLRLAISPSLVRTRSGVFFGRGFSRCMQRAMARLPPDRLADARNERSGSPDNFARGGMLLPVVVLTAHGDVATTRAALKNGAVDFLEKPVDDDVLIDVLRNAISIDSQRHHTQTQRNETMTRLGRLTPRERDVLHLLAEGLQHREIAARLAISPRTVEVYKSRMMEKLQCRTLAEVVRIGSEARSSQ